MKVDIFNTAKSMTLFMQIPRGNIKAKSVWLKNLF